MKLSILLLACLVHGAAAAIGGDNWLHDPETKAYAEARAASKPALAKRVSINLDLAPKDRWTEVGAMFKDEAPAVIAYFEEYLPKWLFPYVEDIAADLQSYFPADYAEEMSSLAPAMGLKVGDIVAINLIYQIEHIGQTCNASNTTGPVPNCPPHKQSKEPGMCTSALVPDAAGTMFHGRNLDWNIPVPLRPLMCDVDYMKGGKVLFTGSQPVGFIGIMHGVRHNGWSFSLNARDKGGDIPWTILQGLLNKGSMTPTQHVRKTMETVADFNSAVEVLSKGPLLNEAYFNMAGAHAREAAVISRGRDRAVDVWRLSKDGTGSTNTRDGGGATTTKGGGAGAGAGGAAGGGGGGGATPYFLLQTNYDHWEPAPTYDDRRDPAIKHLETLGEGNVGFDGLMGVMTEWPTFNHHTDFTIVFSPNNASHYQTLVWPAAPQ